MVTTSQSVNGTANTTPKDEAEFRVLIVYPNIPLMLIPAIAVGLFTAILKKAGYIVDLFETTHYTSTEQSHSLNRIRMLNVREFDPEADLGIKLRKGDMYDDFTEKLKVFAPDALIISSVEDVFHQAVEFIRISETLNIPHLLGGVFPSYAPDVCINTPEVKLIGIGEGEKPVADFCERVRLRQSLKGIPGTWHKDDEENISKTLPTALVDLNEYHPDFSLFDASRFFRPMGGHVFKMIPVESYRGCPYACTFCNSPTQISLAKANGLGNFLRRKSIAVLEEELLHYIDQYEPTFFYFVDDTFLARPQAEIEEFCEMYRGIEVPFWFNSRAETVDERMLSLLKEVGCYRVSFGIECGNQQYRKEVLQRYVTNDRMIEKFDLVEKSGIAFSLNVIIGMPGETRALVMDTVELIRSIRGYDALTVNVFTPYHGTVLRKVAEKNGWLDPTAITRHTTSSSILTMPKPYLSSEEIDGLAATFPLYCYFPKDVWKDLEHAEGSTSSALETREKYAEIYRRDFLGETQDTKTRQIGSGTQGCWVDPKTQFRVSPERLSKRDTELLTLQVAN